MSLNHRDGGSSSRSGSRKNRKLGERVTPREEPVSGYQETPGPERGARFSGGQRLRQAGEDGLRARRCLRDATGLGSAPLPEDQPRDAAELREVPAEGAARGLCPRRASVPGEGTDVRGGRRGKQCELS